jgi:hypothetical protein
VGQQLAGIEHLAATYGHNCIAALLLTNRSDPLQVTFAAVELQLGAVGLKPSLL